MIPFEYILSLPKSLYVSFRLLPFKQAIKVPILVRYNCKLLNLQGLIKIDSGNVKIGMIQIGFGNVGIFDKKYERCILDIQGVLEICGKTIFGRGSRICIGNNGVLRIGTNFSNTAKMTLICFDKINIGNDVLVSWDTHVMDTDFHNTINLETGKISMINKPIIIGDRVWLGMRSVVLKGSNIPNGSIVAANSLVNKSYDIENCLLAGNPAEIRKMNVNLYREK